MADEHGQLMNMKISWQYYPVFMENINREKRLEIKNTTCSICPISIIRTRIVIQEARLKPFCPHTPVNPHIPHKERTNNLTPNIQTSPLVIFLRKEKRLNSSQITETNLERNWNLPAYLCWT